MSERSNLRLLVLAVLVASLLGTLVIRTFYLQVMTGETYRAAAEDNTVREVVEPAVRGLVLDQAGRPLVSNRTSVVVTVDRQTLKKEKDEGVEVIDRLAKILDMPAGKNLVGAFLLIASLTVHFNLAAMVMEIAWAFIAMFGLVKALRERTKP